MKRTRKLQRSRIGATYERLKWEEYFYWQRWCAGTGFMVDGILMYVDMFVNWDMVRRRP